MGRDQEPFATPCKGSASGMRERYGSSLSSAPTRAALTVRTRKDLRLRLGSDTEQSLYRLPALGERGEGGVWLHGWRSRHARERVPLQWAITKANLADALRALGERENVTALLEAAGATEPLRVRASRNVPLQAIRARRLSRRAPDNASTGRRGLRRLRRLTGRRFEEHGYPLEWARAKAGLGRVLVAAGHGATRPSRGGGGLCMRRP